MEEYFNIKKEENSQKLIKRAPKGTQLHVISLLASMKNEGLTLEQVRLIALDEIEASKEYDSAFATSMETMEKAIEFLKKEGVK